MVEIDEDAGEAEDDEIDSGIDSAVFSTNLGVQNIRAASRNFLLLESI